MSTKPFNLPITTFCEECGSDLEIADFDTVRVGEKMVLQFNVKPCTNCKENWLESGAEDGRNEHEERQERGRV
jgi:hypothetical protein